jgi:ATP-dependent Clp protease protease subunit
MPTKLNTDLPYIISNFYINQLVNEIEAIEDNEIEMSWLSYGGSVWAGWQLADYLKQSDKKITARVTGIAASMGGVLLPYFDKVVGAKQADIMIHSTSASPQSLAKKSNEELYNVLSKKIKEDVFKEVTGKELKDVLFAEGDDRVDVWLSGEEAYKMGLFDELIDLTPDETAKNKALLKEMDLAASLNYKLPKKITNKIGVHAENINNQNSQMDLQKLKAEHPDLYNEVLQLGVKAEQERVNTWMVFNDIDPEKVKAGISSGNAMSEPEKLTFMRAAQTADLQASLEANSQGVVNPNKENGKSKSKAEKEGESLDALLEDIEIKED